MGAVIPPEEEAHGLGEITGEVVPAPCGEERFSPSAARAMPEEACVPGGGDVATMQEEEAPAGLAASCLVLAFQVDLFALTCLLLFCRNGRRATRLNATGTPSSGACGEKEGRRGPGPIVKEVHPGVENNCGSI